MKTPLALLAAIACLFLSAPNLHCAPLPDAAVSNGINAFACDLYAKLRNGKGNLFFSPLSVSCALAAAGAGTRGETAAQIARTLHLPANARAHQDFADLMRRLNAMNQDDGQRLEIANSLWPDKQFSLLPEYVALAQKYFDAAVVPVDYTSDAVAAADRINAWVEQKTQGRIRDFLSVPPASTRLILINTVYFKGLWLSPFERHSTKEDLFHAPDKPLKIPFMSQTASFGYQQADGLQILELPYAGGKLSLFVLLPEDKPGALEKLEKELSPERLAQWTNASTLQRRDVLVFLPKFKLSWKSQAMAQTLKALGIHDAFLPHTADFSGMSPQTGLFIDSVAHQANMDVDEEGSVAAAATGIAIRATAAPIKPVPVFRADRPFLFFIRENTGGTILFLGRLTAP